MLQNIRIVLVETSHTGNMGSVARAMKTMGLTNLWLVNPLVKPDSQAIALAAGASDVIGNAQIVDTLDEALAGCSLVVGTSARSRTLPWPMLDPRECGLKSVAEGQHAPVALVFGRERVGLTNDELQKCHYHVAIAANPEYSSLNLAMAVQVIAYEVRMAWLATQEQDEPAAEHEETPYPLVDDFRTFLWPPRANPACHRFYSRQPPGTGDEQTASSVYPRASGKPGAEYPAWYAGVYRSVKEREVSASIP